MLLRLFLRCLRVAVLLRPLHRGDWSHWLDIPPLFVCAQSPDTVCHGEDPAKKDGSVGLPVRGAGPPATCWGPDFFWIGISSSATHCDVEDEVRTVRRDGAGRAVRGNRVAWQLRTTSSVQASFKPQGKTLACCLSEDILHRNNI